MKDLLLSNIAYSEEKLTLIDVLYGDESHRNIFGLTYRFICYVLISLHPIVLIFWMVFIFLDKIFNLFMYIRKYFTSKTFRQLTKKITFERPDRK